MKLAMIKPSAAQARVAARAPTAQMKVTVPEFVKRAAATAGVSLAALALSGSALAATVKLGADNGECVGMSCRCPALRAPDPPSRAVISAPIALGRLRAPKPRRNSPIARRNSSAPARRRSPSRLHLPHRAGSLVFDPATVTIAKGESITWVNNVGFPHNIVFDEDAVPGGVNAEALGHEEYLNAPGEKHTVKFDTAGEYGYYCEPHQGAGMVGKVIVQ